MGLDHEGVVNSEMIRPFDGENTVVQVLLGGNFELPDPQQNPPGNP